MLRQNPEERLVSSEIKKRMDIIQDPIETIRPTKKLKYINLLLNAIHAIPCVYCVYLFNDNLFNDNLFDDNLFICSFDKLKLSEIIRLD